MSEQRRRDCVDGQWLKCQRETAGAGVIPDEVILQFVWGFVFFFWESVFYLIDKKGGGGLIPGILGDGRDITDNPCPVVN